MSVSIFDFSQYKPYLIKRIGGFRARNGQRLALANALHCQATQVSLVLNGDAQFTLEQGERVNRFLGHSEDEGEYFYLLLQRERAGTQELKKFFDKKIDLMLKERQEVVNRLGKRANLTKEEQGIYYSSWHYSAFHIAISIPELRSREALRDYFRLPMEKVTKVLEQLEAMGLIKSDGKKYSYTSENLRLGRDSHNIIKHHTNWRAQATESLDREKEEDLHYSAVLSMSKTARAKIKDILLENLKDNLKIIEESPEEELVGFCIDFFSLSKN